MQDNLKFLLHSACVQPTKLLKEMYLDSSIRFSGLEAMQSTEDTVLDLEQIDSFGMKINVLSNCFLERLSRRALYDDRFMKSINLVDISFIELKQTNRFVKCLSQAKGFRKFFLSDPLGLVDNSAFFYYAAGIEQFRIKYSYGKHQHVLAYLKGKKCHGCEQTRSKLFFSPKQQRNMLPFLFSVLLKLESSCGVELTELVGYLPDCTLSDYIYKVLVTDMSRS